MDGWGLQIQDCRVAFEDSTGKGPWKLPHGTSKAPSVTYCYRVFGRFSTYFQGYILDYVEPVCEADIAHEISYRKHPLGGFHDLGCSS